MKLMKLKRMKPIMRMHGFGILLILSTIACGSPQDAAPAASQSADQPVAYGASLEEWDDSVSSEGAAPEPTALSSGLGAAIQLTDVVYEEILWDALVPADFTADAIMAKYQDQLSVIQDGSPEANDLYIIMQEEFDNAPVKEAMDGVFIKLPGFIAPLEFTGDMITEFLLVPYFGACIHVPAPPANQTVLVTTGDDYGISLEESYNPVWILGKLTTEGATTDLAKAGYVVHDAIIEPYTGP